MWPKHLVFVAALFWSSSSLSQGFLHGDDLYRFCKMADETPERTTCIAFIIGAVDALTETHEVCLPNDVVGKQVVDIVVNYLLSHPETRANAAATEVDAALKRYRCNNSN
jgi:Rap1a immunity proteins